MAVFCLGFGYVAARFKDLYQAHYRFVDGTSSHQMPHTLRFENHTKVKDRIRESDTILISTPPTKEGCPSLLCYGHTLHNQHVIYLSATSVYGDHQGRVVTEKALCLPQTQNGLNRLRAEHQWQALADEKGFLLTILRLSGLYGPKRSIFDRLDNLKERVDVPGHVFSRIHVDDVVAIIALISQQPISGIFNVADDVPASSRAIIEYACDIKRIQYPPLVSLEDALLSDKGRFFYQERKRVSAEKVKTVLGYSLKFPSYQEGLKDISNDLLYL